MEIRERKRKEAFGQRDEREARLVLSISHADISDSSHAFKDFQLFVKLSAVVSVDCPLERKGGFIWKYKSNQCFTR
ncbi:hypothetical protein NECAME_09177 [Necator americanus]|uniref:Uncharacterized protein n=1 Tax=Necator americanus TaxID=51031 RepID=W2THG3_NECAM|nr:hypothetical protein NECAME_09177 [Necator americanus]ETN80447.1 hypothetical protein NECAME_09177 [Necator americanus]